MPNRVVFYKLSHKYVDTRDAARLPQASRQIIYYSLAVGHHLGVVDCLSSVVDTSYAEFGRCLASLPARAGRRKLEGVLKWGEIEINATHVRELIETLDMGRDRMDEKQVAWANALKGCLQDIQAEPALYLMVRSH